MLIWKVKIAGRQERTHIQGARSQTVCVGGGMPMQRQSTLEGTTIMVGEAWWRRQLSALSAECEVLTHIWIDGNIETDMRQAVGPG